MVTKNKFDKAVFLNYSGGELWSQYWHRVDMVVKNKVLISASDPKLAEELEDADALLLRPVGDKIDKDFINKAPNLRYIGMMGTGTGGIDTAYCKSKSIVVTNVKDYATEGVVEMAFGMIFDHIRGIERAKKEARAGDYSGSTFSGTEIKGKRFGVIGLGHIGCRVAEIAKAFGAEVVYWSRNRKTSEEVDLGINYVEIDELLETSDFISINLALNSETNNFLNSERLSKIKKGAIVVNPSPMELVNFEALIKRLGKYDMTFMFDHSDELKVKDLDLLKGFGNCIIHLPIGYTTDEATAKKQGVFLENMESFLVGLPTNVVNLNLMATELSLTGPGYESVTIFEREQWSKIHLRAFREGDEDIIIGQDQTVYPTVNVVKPTTVDSWYKKNPEFGMIYEIDNNVVGTCAVIPLNRDGWERAVSGKLAEADISAKHIFDNKTDKEVGLYIYQIERKVLSEKFFSRIFLDLSETIRNLKKTNPRLKVVGAASLCTSNTTLDVFQKRLDFKESGYISTEHILSKGSKLSLVDEKVVGREKLNKMINEGYVYHHRCKLLVIRPEEFSLVWSYIDPSK
jgi:phosphoglycerate dehydrogenase-like enzyme